MGEVKFWLPTNRDLGQANSILGAPVFSSVNSMKMIGGLEGLLYEICPGSYPVALECLVGWFCEMK